MRSADGTALAVWAEGASAPLVLVHGAVSDHTTLAPLVDALVRRNVVTFALDRRRASGAALTKNVGRLVLY